MENSQQQKAGSNSRQTQIGVVQYIGIDEKRVREIFDEKIPLAMSCYTQEAVDIAIERVREFQESLIPKIVAIENGIKAFADPSFQLLLIEAQKSAASTERPADYDLLTELLVNRVQKGGERIIRASISKAVEIVEEISDDALNGLTVFHLMSVVSPQAGNIQEGLDVLDNLYGNIICGELPVGSSWLDHLDVLNAVRISSFGNIKKIQEYLPEKLEGYVAAGIKKDSEEFNKAIEILNNSKLPLDFLAENPLNTDYVRIGVPNKMEINRLHYSFMLYTSIGVKILRQPLSDLGKNSINAVYNLYSRDGVIKEQNIQKFMIEWDKRKNLKKLREWWDNLPSMQIEITSVGRALAHANAQRCDKSLPALDL